MTNSGEVLLEVDDGVAVVTLNAPDRRNALTPSGRCRTAGEVVMHPSDHRPVSGTWTPWVGCVTLQKPRHTTCVSDGQSPSGPPASRPTPSTRVHARSLPASSRQDHSRRVR